MNANKTSNAGVTLEGWDVAPRKEPGRWVVTVGYYRAESGRFLLVPILSYRPEGTKAEKQAPEDWAFIGPVYGLGELGFDLLSRTTGDFSPLFSTAEDFPSLPVDDERRTELVLLVGPDKVSPEWVSVGVWDSRVLHAVGFAFRFDESNVADWLWTTSLPRVTAEASPESVREQLAEERASRW